MLSGGQRQRVGPGPRPLPQRRPAHPRRRAVGRRPPDRGALVETVAGLARRGSSPTVIIASHRQSALRHCEQVWSWSGGRLVDSGSHARARQATRPYRDTWLIQSQRAAAARRGGLVSDRSMLRALWPYLRPDAWAFVTALLLTPAPPHSAWSSRGCSSGPSTSTSCPGWPRALATGAGLPGGGGRRLRAGGRLRARPRLGRPAQHRQAALGVYRKLLSLCRATWTASRPAAS
jgi:hypothetical protein